MEKKEQKQEKYQPKTIGNLTTEQFLELIGDERDQKVLCEKVKDNPSYNNCKKELNRYKSCERTLTLFRNQKPLLDFYRSSDKNLLPMDYLNN